MLVIDDFLILGPSIEVVQAAFSLAQNILRSLGLTAYTPGASKKAKQGDARKGVVFLGCNLTTNTISPAADSHKRIRREVQRILDESAAALASDSESRIRRHAYAATLYDIDHSLKGWGDQYAFCNAKDLMGNIDQEVDKLLDAYEKKVRRILKKKTGGSLRRRLVLGVHALRRSKHDPIIDT